MFYLIYNKNTFHAFQPYISKVKTQKETDCFQLITYNLHFI
jgi:hypothetical protein